MSPAQERAVAAFSLVCSGLVVVALCVAVVVAWRLGAFA
jgi:hypothetical protein